MELSEKAVLKTLIYAGIFSFPLTQDEIWQYLISPNSFTKKEVKKATEKLLKKAIIFEHSGYIGIDKNSEDSIRRGENTFSLKEKIIKAQKAAEELGNIPSVLFVGISGGVAVGNVRDIDDIDFFIVTKKDTIWVTRFLCIFRLRKLGLLRGRNDKNVKDKICLNMFLSENSIGAPVQKQDLYIAHEISQLLPLFSKENTYEKIITENTWVKNFLPNFKQKKQLLNLKIKNSKSTIIYRFPFRNLIKFLQLTYIKRHRKNETVSDNILAFHPHDYRKYVLSSYDKEILRYNLSQ